MSRVVSLAKCQRPCEKKTHGTTRMMTVKRKHEGNVPVEGTPKKLKLNDTATQKSKKWKQEIKTSSSSGGSPKSHQKKASDFKGKSKELKDFQKNKDSDITDNDKHVGGKSGRKRKAWKHWDKMKKRKKNKAHLKNGPNKAKSVPDKAQSPPLEKKIDVSKKTAMPEPVSCNWKKLKMDLKQTNKKKNHKKKHFKKKEERRTENKEDKSAEPDIWFDDVDEELLKPTNAKTNTSKPKPVIKSSVKSSGEADGLVKEHSFKGITKAVALDCEMVGVGETGKESVLARVSVVNQYGECLYDTFVRSREEVVDYRTRWSGVTPEKLENATDFLDAQKAVSDILRGRILVGHAVHHDLKVLFLDHPRKDIRDTSLYKPYRQLFKGRTPSLKNLTSRLLNVKIQTGEHNSVTDAQAAMRLYTFSRQEWEKHRRKKRIHKTKSQKTKTKE